MTVVGAAPSTAGSWILTVRETSPILTWISGVRSGRVAANGLETVPTGSGRLAARTFTRTTAEPLFTTVSANRGLPSWTDRSAKDSRTAPEVSNTCRLNVSPGVDVR